MKPEDLIIQSKILINGVQIEFCGYKWYAGVKAEEGTTHFWFCLWHHRYRIQMLVKQKCILLCILNNKHSIF